MAKNTILRVIPRIIRKGKLFFQIKIDSRISGCNGWCRTGPKMGQTMTIVTYHNWKRLKANWWAVECEMCLSCSWCARCKRGLRWPKDSCAWSVSWGETCCNGMVRFGGERSPQPETEWAQNWEFKVNWTGRAIEWAPPTEPIRRTEHSPAT